eukprot:scaffold5893_cov37-Cyclotella_meneghiniana.AAC.2
MSICFDPSWSKKQQCKVGVFTTVDVALLQLLQHSSFAGSANSGLWTSPGLCFAFFVYPIMCIYLYLPTYHLFTGIISIAFVLIPNTT